MLPSLSFQTNHPSLYMYVEWTYQYITYTKKKKKNYYFPPGVPSRTFPQHPSSHQSVSKKKTAYWLIILPWVPATSCHMYVEFKRKAEEGRERNSYHTEKKTL